MSGKYDSLTVDDIRKIRDDMHKRHYNPDFMKMLKSMEEEIHCKAVKAQEIIDRTRREQNAIKYAPRSSAASLASGAWKASQRAGGFILMRRWLNRPRAGTAAPTILVLPLFAQGTIAGFLLQ